MSEYESFAGNGIEPVPQKVEDPPLKAPDPGNTYQRIEGEPTFPVIEVPWQHEKHATHAANRAAKNLEPPFYVSLPSGAIGWVPWPGSVVVSEADAGWSLDMLRDATPIARPSKKSKT